MTLLAGPRPSRARGRAGDFAAAPRTEGRGASGTSLEAAQSAERGGVRIGLDEVPRQNPDALRGGVASRAGRADGVGRFQLADFLGEIADQAAAFGGDVSVPRVWNA